MLAKYPRHVSTITPLVEWFCPVHTHTFLVNIAGRRCRCPDCDRFGGHRMATTNGVSLDIVNMPHIRMTFVKGHVRLFVHGYGRGYFKDVEEAMKYLKERGYLT